MSDKIRLGVLGVSSHFLLRVATPLLHSSQVEIYAIASRSKIKAEIAAARWGIPVAYGSYEELLNDPNVDFVYNPLPNHLHAPLIIKSADAGKPMICEKPIALSSREAQEALEYARKKEVLIMEAFMYKFHPQWKRVRELIKMGEIGKVRLINTLFCYSNTDPGNIRNQADIGGGALMDIGCYSISVPRFLLGREPDQVISLISRDENFNTDELSSAILDFGTVRATFTVSTQLYSYQQVQILGTGGIITVHIPFNTPPDVPAEVTVTTGVSTRVIRFDPADHYGLEFEAFARAVNKGGPSPVDSRDAEANMAVIEALFKSEKSGTWEKL